MDLLYVPLSEHHESNMILGSDPIALANKRMLCKSGKKINN